MLQTALWSACVHCGHPVNPRSERCDVDHPPCGDEGCEIPGQSPNTRFAHPLTAAAPTQRQAQVMGGGAPTPTTYMIDIASYQRGIQLAAVKAAGYTKVNIKTSQGNWYQFADAVTYAKAAASLGMGVSVFHWLDNSTDGATQARYCWQILSRIIAAVGHPVPIQCDNEDSARPAPYATVRDFVATIRQLAGYPPYMYTGDWYATAAGRAGWNIAALAPHLMAAPNAGYLGSYPGDSSPHWNAGYWGYNQLALMQYDVSPIPNAGGGSISKSAIRDPAVWAALTGGPMTTPNNPLQADDGNFLNGVFMTEAVWSLRAQLAGGPHAGWDSEFVKRFVALEKNIQTLLATEAAESTAIAGLKTALDALAAVVNKGSGNVDVATITAAVQAKADEVKQLVEQRHAEEMAVLKASHDAEVAGLQAELSALRGN